MQPQGKADPGGLPWSRARVPAHARQGLALGPEDSSMGLPASDSGTANPEAYVPTAMDLQYTAREGPSRLPSPGWVLEAHEAAALHEPP